MLEGTAARTRQSYHGLADGLRDDILSGVISDGAPLPNERELGGQTGLSRNSVREALRVLEAEVLVLTRKGRNGGSVVQLPGVAIVSRMLEPFVRGQRVAFDTVLVAREIEP